MYIKRDLTDSSLVRIEFFTFLPHYIVHLFIMQVVFVWNNLFVKKKKKIGYQLIFKVSESLLENIFKKKKSSLWAWPLNNSIMDMIRKKAYNIIIIKM